MKSWRTTFCGLAAIVVTMLKALSAQFDGDPNTVPDWTSCVAAASAGIGLLAARDNKVTSESAGAK